MAVASLRVPMDESQLELEAIGHADCLLTNCGKGQSALKTSWGAMLPSLSRCLEPLGVPREELDSLTGSAPPVFGLPCAAYFPSALRRGLLKKPRP